MRATDGFLSSPATDVRPRESQTVLSPFLQNIINKRKSKLFAANTSKTHSSIPIRPDSPVSVDSGSHSSDRDFINDKDDEESNGAEISDDNDDAEMSDDDDKP